MDIGISTGIIYNYNLLDKLLLIKEAGFDVIEICFKACSSEDKMYRFDYQNWLYIYEIKEKLEKHGLRVESIHMPYADDLDISDLNEERRISAVGEIKNMIDILRLLDGNILIIHPTVKKISEGNFEERNLWFAQAQKSVRDIVFYAENKGVKIALENLLPHIFFGDNGDLLRLVEPFNSRNLGICLDTSHANLNRGTVDAIRKFSKNIIALHVSDNCGDKDSHLPIGEGNIRWEEFMGELNNIGFNGIFMLEILKKVNVDDLPGMLKSVYEKTKQFLGEKN